MPLVSFIKKLFSAKEEETPEEKAKIEFKDIGIKLDEISKTIEQKEKIVDEEIEKKAEELNEKLKEQILILKSISLEERKESEKLKFIVMENLSFYVNSLEKLADNLKKKQGIEQVKLNLSNFSKNTKNNFEKASILIGKELEIVKEAIKDFVISFNKIIENNKDVFEKKKKIGDIKKLIGKIEELGKQKTDYKENIEKREKEKREKEKEKNEKEKEIAKIKESSEYLEITESKKIKEKEKEKIKEKVRKIKEKINFKELKRNHHTNSKNMEIVKNYEENFILALEEKPEFLEIIGNEQIVRELKEIKDKLVELNEIRENDTEKSIREHEETLKQIGGEMSSIRINVDEEIEKIKKTEEKTEEIKREIREKLEHLNISLL